MPRVTLSRTEHFCASHRLHSSALTEEENRQLFGKCNLPNGHGHNYSIDVLITGELDEKSGVLISLTTLKEMVQRLVIEKLDHRHLNLDIEEFRELNPTAENIAIVIWRLLRSELPDHLELEVRLHETAKNIAIYRGE